MLKKILISLLIVFSLFSLTACSQAAEKITEQIIEDNASGDVDVDLEDGSVNITDGDGNQFAAGDSIPLPDNWPADIPTYDGNLTTVSIDKNGGSVLASWRTEDSLSDAYESYNAALESAGFALTSDTTQTDYRMTTYESSTYSVLLSISFVDGVTTVSVIADTL